MNFKTKNLHFTIQNIHYKNLTKLKLKRIIHPNLNQHIPHFMKNIIYLILTLLVSTSLQAQTSLPKPGQYIMLQNGNRVTFDILEDSTYRIVASRGKYSVEDEKLIFTASLNHYPSDFQILVEDGSSKDSLDLVFENSFSYSYDTYYVGYKKPNQEEMSYFNILTLIQNKYGEYSYDSIGDFVIRIPKINQIHTLKKGYDGKNSGAKFEIPAGTSKIKLTHSPKDESDSNLVGSLDSNGNLLISNLDGLEIARFSHENDLSRNLSKYIDPYEIEVDSLFEGLDFTLDEEDENLLYESPDYSFDTSEYVFTVTKYTEHAEALKALSNEPEKILVIVYDPKKKEQKFDTFLKVYENSMNNQMYGVYNSEYDKYLFLYIQEPLPGLIPKTNKPHVLMQNDLGLVFYTSEGTINDHQELLNQSSYFFDDFHRASIHAQINHFVNQKFDPLQSLDLFTKIHNLPSYQNNYEAIETSSSASKGSTKKQLIYQYTPEIRNRQNLAQIEINREDLNLLYKQLIDYHRNNNIASFPLSKIIAQELRNEGFTSKLNPDLNKILTSIDYESIEYYFENEIALQDLCEKDELARNEAGDYSYYFMTDYDCNFRDFISYWFSYGYNYTDSNMLSNNLKILKRLADKGDHYSNMLQYFNISAQYSHLVPLQPAFFEEYDTFITKIKNKNTSIIETLDEYLTEMREGSSLHQYTEWHGFKFEFANLANSIAWDVVEHSNDPQLIQKALEWSLLGNRVEKNNYYCLDTLAQLYYKNGQKELAISTEIEAIALARKSEDEENAIQFEEVLQKMRTNTYGIAK